MMLSLLGTGYRCRDCAYSPDFFAEDDDGIYVYGAANGWDKVDDNNDAKALGGQVGFFPAENVSLYFNYIGSPEQDDNDDDWRHLFGLVWVINPLPNALPNLTFSGTYDYGTEVNVGADGGNAEWYAAQAVLRYDFTPKFYLAVRTGVMADEDGARISPGISQTVWAFTVTPTFSLTENLVVRSEFRYDQSDEDVF